MHFTYHFLLYVFLIYGYYQGQKVPGGSTALKSMLPSAGTSGRGPHMNRNFPGGPLQHSQAQSVNPLIGRKVMSRWPEDNSFYEAVISDYNAETVCFYLKIAIAIGYCLQIFHTGFTAGFLCTAL
jgi:hypothetical protein